MKLIKTGDLVPGMFVARDIYNPNGLLLARKGMQITGDLIRKLTGWNQLEVEVEDKIDLISQGEEKKIIAEVTLIHDRVINLTENIMQSLDDPTNINSNMLKGMVGELKNQIDLNTNVLLNLSHLKNYDHYIFSHVVNVSVLSLIIGRELGLSALELRELGMAALLHDIGMTKIERTLYDQKAQLTTEQWTEVKRHPELGAELLESSEGFSEAVLRGVREHHERCNGSGYPSGLVEDQIHLFAKIIAVADVYDACISLRKYRSRLTPRDALQNLFKESNFFGMEILRAFVNTMAVYPIGTFIKLNTGEVGKVVGINQGEPFRPQLLIYYNRSGERLEKALRVNLNNNENSLLCIDYTLEGAELEKVEQDLINE